MLPISAESRRHSTAPCKRFATTLEPRACDQVFSGNDTLTGVYTVDDSADVTPTAPTCTAPMWNRCANR